MCSFGANAPFSIIFSNILYFKGIKRRYYEEGLNLQQTFSNFVASFRNQIRFDILCEFLGKIRIKCHVSFEQEMKEDVTNIVIYSSHNGQIKVIIRTIFSENLSFNKATHMLQ